MTNLPKLIYRFNALPIIILAVCLCKIKQADSKMDMEKLRFQNNPNTFKKYKAEGPNLILNLTIKLLLSTQHSKGKRYSSMEQNKGPELDPQVTEYTDFRQRHKGAAVHTSQSQSLGRRLLLGAKGECSWPARAFSRCSILVIYRISVLVLPSEQHLCFTNTYTSIIITIFTAPPEQRFVLCNEDYGSGSDQPKTNQRYLLFNVNNISITFAENFTSFGLH